MKRSQHSQSADPGAANPLQERWSRRADLNCGPADYESAFPPLSGNINLIERFWPKVEITPTCWNWTAALNTAGYGLLGRGGKTRVIQAHRASYLIHVGPIPDGMLICHRCDNTRCVRPTHLFAGTSRDNIEDAKSKGRFHNKLDGLKVIEIRKAAARGASVRELLERYGVSASTIRGVINRTYWKHIP